MSLSLKPKPEFRFATSDFPRLAEALIKIPKMFTCCNGTTASRLEGLCIMLKIFAYPCLSKQTFLSSIMTSES